jgi:hypothetical protein
MSATERLLEIEEAFAEQVARIVVLELDGETLRLIMYHKDGTNLRVAEQWLGDKLKRYSYYWLSEDNQPKIGWDNAPHHTQLSTFPHHKHVSGKRIPEAATETSLEDVMATILSPGVDETLA